MLHSGPTPQNEGVDVRAKQAWRRAAAAAIFVTLPACAGNELGALGDILGGAINPAGAGGTAQQGELRVQIEGVNAQQQAIQVRTDQGQTGTVLYDQNTVVVYRQQQYPATELERGDIAVMQVQQIDQNRIYASRIDVQQSVQERTGQAAPGSTGQRYQLSGQVGQIDHQRGSFELRTQQGIYTVFIPQNAGAATNDYFHRLRTGATVSVEGTRTGADGINLYRFL